MLEIYQIEVEELDAAEYANGADCGEQSIPDFDEVFT